jgi:hypothetical protein
MYPQMQVMAINQLGVGGQTFSGPNIFPTWYCFPTCFLSSFLNFFSKFAQFLYINVSILGGWEG